MQAPRRKLLTEAVEKFHVQVLTEYAGRDLGSLRSNKKHGSDKVFDRHILSEG